MLHLYHSELLNPLIGFKHNAKALINDNSSITLAKLFQKSKQLSVGLLCKGFAVNDIVLITLPPGEEFLAIIYAIAMLRGRVAIIDPEMGRINFAAKLKQLAPKWAFVDSRLLFLRDHPVLDHLLHKIKRNVPQVPLIRDCTVVSVGMPFFARKKYLHIKELVFSEEPMEFIHNDSDDEFLIIYTSGTIQEPKGVVHSIKSITKSITNLVRLIDEKPGDILGTQLPHYMLLGIAAGIPVHILSSTNNPRKKIREIEQKKITLLFGAPSEYLPMIKYCESTNTKLPESLRKVFFGSAPVHTTFLKRFFAVAPQHVQAICLYGMTELLLCAGIDGKDKLSKINCRGDVLGELFDDVECKISPDGEILLRSPQLFKRYFHEKASNEFHASGDTGYLDNRRNLVLTGRKKDMIIRKDFNIYPAIYETIIRNIEGVNDCALIGIWNEQKEDEEVYLALEGVGLNPEGIKRHLEYGPNAIPKEALPDKIVCTPVPRIGKHKKIDKKKLRDLLVESERV